jgi:hypothetical protein
MGKICGEDDLQGKGGKKRTREECSREKDKGNRKEYNGRQRGAAQQWLKCFCVFGVHLLLCREETPLVPEMVA